MQVRGTPSPTVLQQVSSSVRRKFEVNNPCTFHLRCNCLNTTFTLMHNPTGLMVESRKHYGDRKGNERLGPPTFLTNSTLGKVNWAASAGNWATVLKPLSLLCRLLCYKLLVFPVTDDCSIIFFLTADKNLVNSKYTIWQCELQCGVIAWNHCNEQDSNNYISLVIIH